MNTPATAKDSKDAKQGKKGADESVKGPDIGTLSDDELSALIATAQGELSSRKEKKRSEFFASIREQAKALGFDPSEVAAALGRNPKRPKGSGDKRAAVAPIYRNPANHAETWAGWGAKPLWVRAALEAGKSLDEFKIPTP